MACELVSWARPDLLQLEDRLLDEGFQFLLTVLPRQLFQLHQQEFIVRDELAPLIKGSERTVFAYFWNSEDVDVDLEESLKYQSPSYVLRRRGDPKVKLPCIQDREIATFNRIPPLSWYSSPDPGYSDSGECRDHTTALIKYFLLRWASDNNCNVPLPQPTYEHLVGAFAKLKSTLYYKSREVIFEDPERIDVQMSFRKVEDFCIRNFSYPVNKERSAEVDEMEEKNVELRHSAGANLDLSTTSGKPGGMGLVNDNRLPTPRQSPKDPALDIDMADSAELMTREASVASAADAASPFGGALSQAKSLNVDPTLPLETDLLARRSLPTPETPTEEAAVIETDPTLSKIRKEMGHDTLSLLPDLDMCTFKRIHTSQPGFLGLRLLLGTLQGPARPQLDGSEVWASFKMHDRGARAAPRMNVHAFEANTDNIIDDDLKIKEILPDLRLGAAFKGIHGGERPEELQLKALVKYYFIIAARSSLLGFDKHCMPFNGSFVEQLKIVCKRLQMIGSSGDDDDQGIESRPVKRLKRLHDRIPTTTSDADDESALVARTRNGRRLGRRTDHMQPLSTTVSENEDNVLFAPITSAPQRTIRRLALGVKVPTKGRNEHGEGAEADAANEVHSPNEFLNPDIEPADSSGDSGDEIPTISDDHSAFIKKRQMVYYQLMAHRGVVKRQRKQIDSLDMGSRKVKGKLKNATDPAERSALERDLAHRGDHMQAVKTHLAVQEHILAGWKAKKKEMDAAAELVDPRTMEVWKALHRYG